MLSKPQTYVKAIVATIVAAGGAFSVAVADGVITGGEWAGIVVAGAVAFGAVYQLPNAETPPDNSREG